MIKLIDTFKAFYPYYIALNDPVKRYEAWNLYMDQYPVIKQMCIKDYQQNHIDYKELALKKIFNHDDHYINKIEVSYQNLMDLLVSNPMKFNGLLPIDFHFSIILYFGLGNGAGWATLYQNEPAILLGIDKIAELSWTDKQTLSGLIMHEYAHIAHAYLRKINLDEFENLEDNPFFRMYSEGFASFYEDISNQGFKARSPWFASCLKKEEELKKIYLEKIENHVSDWTNFYGDWHQVMDLSDAGYFLGYRMIQSLSNRYSLSEIATFSLGQIKAASMTYLSTLSPKDESLEFWDAYDKDENRLGMILQRGKKILDHVFHIVVECLIVNQYGEILLTRRGPNKTYPLMWEIPGGSILCGETPQSGLIREIQEETGIHLLDHQIIFLDHKIERNSIYKMYVAKVEDPKVIVDHHETIDYIWLKYQDFLHFIQEREFTEIQKQRFNYIHDLFKKATSLK